MSWVVAFTALAFCGIAVLGVLGARVYLATARLARQIEESAGAFADAAERFQHTAEPLAARAGEMVRG